LDHVPDIVVPRWVVKHSAAHLDRTRGPSASGFSISGEQTVKIAHGVSAKEFG